MNAWYSSQDSQPGCSLRSRERDLLLCGEDGLGGLLRLELLEAVECLGESESYGFQREMFTQTRTQLFSVPQHF